MNALTLPAAFVAVTMFLSMPALAQSTKSQRDCVPQPSASPGTATRTQKAPEKIEGRVTQVDPKTGMLTVQRPDGTTHQFRGSKDTVEEYKPGDRIELTLRAEPC